MSGLRLYPRESAKQLPFSNVPPWLVKYLGLMLAHEKTRVVGSLLSCERDVHVQAYSALVDARALRLVFPHLQSACAIGATWDDATDNEVGVSTSVLDAGFSVAGIYPSSFKHFTNDQRKALQRGDKEILHKMDYCENVMRVDRNDFLGNADLPEGEGGLVLYKYGGDMFRSGLFSQAFADRVHAATVRMLELDGTEKTVSCYRQVFKRGRRPLTLLRRKV
jgi:hypothetical protein